MNALDELSVQEVRYLCTVVGVEQRTLNNIDADHRDGLNRVPGYLQAWLDRNEDPSWAAIIEALRSKRLNKIVLAEKLTEKFCPDLDKTSSSSSYKTPPSSLAPSEDEDDMPPPNQLMVFRREVVGQKLQSTAEKVSGYEEEFLSLVQSTKDHLQRKKISKSDLYYFKASLTKLPMLTKKKRRYFLDKRKRKILRANSMEEVFDILDPYWNYVDYSLLDCIVQSYCDEDVRRLMTSYKERLHQFENETTLESFRLDKVLPKYYSMLTATLAINAAECTLFDVRKKVEKIAQRADLQPYVTQLQRVQTGRTQTSLFIGFPRSVYKRLKRSLNREFLQEIGMSPQSLSFKKKPDLLLQESIRHLNVLDLGLQENIFGGIMPQPRYCGHSIPYSSNRGSSFAEMYQPRQPCSLPPTMGRYSSFNGSVQSFLHEHASLVQDHAALVHEHASLLYGHFNIT